MEQELEQDLNQESYENPWMFKNKIFTSEDINNAHGMVYLIEEISTGKMYIGQKQLWTKKTRTINKKKKKIKVDSDWKKYWSSSSYIKEKVLNEGHDDFRRYVLMLCISTGQLNYMEMKLQMDLRVLEKPEFYLNGFIGGKISTSHIKNDSIMDVDYDLLNTLYSKTYFGFKP